MPDEKRYPLPKSAHHLYADTKPPFLDKKGKPKKKKEAPVCSDISQLESFWQKTGQASKAENVIIKYDFIANPEKRFNQDVTLYLTKELSFSMSLFDKVNKGLMNSSINCYMNVNLQSLLACPAFFNMCCLINKNEKLFEHDQFLMKISELSKFFDPQVLILASEWQSNEINQYNKTRVVDAQTIFATELMDFNPEHIHQDCSEFLGTVLLEKLHSSLKSIYIPSEKAVDEKQQ